MELKSFYKDKNKKWAGVHEISLFSYLWRSLCGNDLRKRIVLSLEWKKEWRMVRVGIWHMRGGEKVKDWDMDKDG